MRLSPAAGPASGSLSVNVCLLIDTDMKVPGEAEPALKAGIAVGNRPPVCLPILL